MSTWTKWMILPVALLMTGTLALAQSEQQPAQVSNPTVTAPEAQNGALTAVGTADPGAKEGPLYGDPSISGNTSLLLATAGVNRAMDELSQAFANKDLDAVKQLWPSMPPKPYDALSKSMDYFTSVSRNFKTEKVDLNGGTATVSGRYSGAFVKGTTVIPSSGKFHATLVRVGTQWSVVTLVCK